MAAEGAAWWKQEEEPAAATGQGLEAKVPRAWQESGRYNEE